MIIMTEIHQPGIRTSRYICIPGVAVRPVQVVQEKIIQTKVRRR